MSKDSFVFHHDYIDIDEFDADEIKELLGAMIAYSADDTEPTFNDRVLRIAWKGIKSRMDADRQAYDERCEQNRRNANKRWSKDDANACDRMQSDKVACEPMRTDAKNADIDIDIESDIDIDIEKKNARARETRHKYGQYNHVRLSDSEIKRLYDDYGEEKTLKAIRKLDEYIQQTGKKYKDHNLALRNWCFKAVDEDEERSRPRAPARDSITEGKTRTGFLNFEPRQYNRDLVRQIEALS